jgi:hypothetical protein
MPNNENYERDPKAKLTALLNEYGWQRIGGGVWQKGVTRLLVDEVGVFLFQWLESRWLRTHGLAHASMIRIARTRELSFSDGSKLNFESGLFTPAPKSRRRR